MGVQSARESGRIQIVSPRRNGIGPHRIQNGAIMKQTFTGKDKCWHRVCTGKPKHIITDPFGQRVWVCKSHIPNNPYEDS